MPELTRGALLQIDGSPFAWLQTIGPTFMLLGAIEESRSTLWLAVRKAEDVDGYDTRKRQHSSATTEARGHVRRWPKSATRNYRHGRRLDKRRPPSPLRLSRSIGGRNGWDMKTASRSPKGASRGYGRSAGSSVTELRLRGIASVEFADGLMPELNRRFQSELGELYGPLRNPDLFSTVTIDREAHTLVWPNGADFDPAILHDWPDHEASMIALAQRWAAAARGERTG